MGVFEKYVEKLKCAECGGSNRLRLWFKDPLDTKPIWVCELCMEDGSSDYQPRVIHIDQKHKMVVINEVPNYEESNILYPSEPKGAA